MFALWNNLLWVVGISVTPIITLIIVHNITVHSPVTYVYVL